jgi:hypothetical protein
MSIALTPFSITLFDLILCFQAAESGVITHVQVLVIILKTQGKRRNLTIVQKALEV